MMDERKLRRPGWTEGHWLELGDGQRWCLPTLEFKPDLEIRPTGAALPAECKTIPELPGYLLVFNEARGVGAQAYVIRAIVARLLKANYLLDDAGAQALLPFGINGVDPGFEGGVLGSAMEALTTLVLKPAMAAAVLGITPPGVN